MDAHDLTASGVCYTTHNGNTAPIWDGAKFTDMLFIDSALSLSGTVAGSIHDIFAPAGGGSMFLGPAWASYVTRSVPVEKYLGVWCDAARNTLLGSVYITAAGETKWQARPLPCPYGPCNILGISNVYNRVSVRALCRDSTETWQYFASSVRYANNSDRWRIYWLDCLGLGVVRARYKTSLAGTSSAAAAATVGAILDPVGYPLTLTGGELEQFAMNSQWIGGVVAGDGFATALQGLHCYQAAEQSTNIAVSFFGNDFSALTVDVET